VSLKFWMLPSLTCTSLNRSALVEEEWIEVGGLFLGRHQSHRQLSNATRPDSGEQCRECHGIVFEPMPIRSAASQAKRSLKLKRTRQRRDVGLHTPIINAPSSPGPSPPPPMNSAVTAHADMGERDLHQSSLAARAQQPVSAPTL